MRFALVCLSMAAAALSAPGFAAQQFPVRPVRIIVPCTPGGGSDITARVQTETSSVETAGPATPADFHELLVTEDQRRREVQKQVNVRLD